MSKPRLPLLCALLLLAGSGAAALPDGEADFVGTDLNPAAAARAHRGAETQALRDAVDETEVLFDGLARESVRQDRAVLGELGHSLRREFKLPEAEDRARRCLELSEEIVRIQAGLEQTEQRAKDADELGRQRLEPRILGLRSDLMNEVDELRRILRSLHKDLNEEKIRDLRNWAMVSEGLLRRRREAAEADAKREAAAQALDGGNEIAPPPPPGAASAESAPETAAPPPAPAKTPAPKRKKGKR